MSNATIETTTEAQNDDHCMTCGEVVETEQVGTSPDIETGEPVPQLECANCGAIGDVTEFRNY